MKATLKFAEGGLQLDSTTIRGAALTENINGQALQPLSRGDLVEVTITAPVDKEPILNILGDTTGAPTIYAPDPLRYTSDPTGATGGTYYTTFNMQEEDVTVEVRYEPIPPEDERFVKLTVVGDLGSGDAQLTDSRGNHTTIDLSLIHI